MSFESDSEREAASKGTKRGYSFSAGGGGSLEGTGASANLSFERSPGELGTEASERVYDPLWTNAITLLDYLSDRDMIERDPTMARIGQFVLATGQVALGDLGVIRKAWDDPVIKRRMAASATDTSSLNRQQRRALERQQSGRLDSGDADLEFVFSLLRLLPHSLQARMLTQNCSLWCSLDAKNLVISASDLFLKHGVVMPGNWNMVGILDALPEALEEDEGIESNEAPLAVEGEFPTSVVGGAAGLVLQNMVAPARLFLGRPVDSYGITPLLIFREVSGG